MKLSIKIALIVTLLALALVSRASAATLVWDELCYAGTWIVSHDPYHVEEWVVTCARFNPDTRQLTWLWAVSCNPAYNVYVRILETRQDVARAQCWLR